MRLERFILGLVILLTLSASVRAAEEAREPSPSELPPPATRAIDFEKEVLPLFSQRCHQCHGSAKQESGLRLDVKKAAFAGGDSGPAFVIGKSGESDLIARVAGKDADTRMPPEGELLTSEQVGVLRAWIDQGAPWPDHLAGGNEKSSHWSFQPPARPEIPPVRYPGWVKNPIDAFVLERLESERIVPSPEADRLTLLRRLSLDLIGLPPTPEEADAFLADTSANAYEKQVDRLLASPHFGERWGRHWLDQARYADSDGYEKDLPRPHAWRYRHWVIDAFNRDLPFDQFTVEQIAGDLLPNATLEQKVATGFHRNTLRNKEGGADQEEDRVKIAKDRVNTTGAVWLGLTVNCCECHSHKYDPLKQREYYGMFAFFNGIDDTDIPAPLPDEAKAYERAKRAHDEAHAPLVTTLASFDREQLATRLSTWEQDLAKTGKIRNSWQVAEPTGFVSEGGASLTKLADHSLLASGANPDKDVYQIVLNTTLQGITALRLEVLPDESLPKKGPGRSSSGNFVLSEIRLRVAPLGDPSRGKVISLQSPTADFSQKQYPAKGAVDGDPKTGWAIGVTENPHQKRIAVFPLAEDAGFENGSTMLLSMDQFHGSSHAIGRFRISLTTASRDELPNLLPDDIPPILALPADQRNDGQKKRLVEYYQTVDPERVRLATLVDEHARQAPKSPETMAQVTLKSKSPRKTFVNVRGDFLRPGDEVGPGTFSVLHSFQPKDDVDPRLSFAQWLVDPANPLTARVTVNRIWQNLFGRGLVATENDFGTQGEPPSHPKLLDWLATEFVSRGWSQKGLIRLIVTSATYKQSSASREDLIDRDPKNVLLARQSRLRLPAEIIRDLYLSVSGLLDDRIGGPSVRPPLPAGVAELGYANSVKWKESEGKDRYRRGLYVFFQRTTPYPMLVTFDAPDSNVTCTRRERSNTPLQALTTLNDPVFFECSQALGRRIVEDTKGSVADRCRRAFRLCLSREPTAEELDRLLKLHEELYALCAANPVNAKQIIRGFEPSEAPPEAATWVLLGRSLLNLDEFVVRE
ncbi:MAG: PSD1 and planctomycete cytochrome C domain-containing protein [Planctomycetota bacterium]